MSAAIPRLAGFVLRLSGVDDVRSGRRGVTARGDGWRLRLGDVTLESLAAEAESARAAGRRPRAYTGRPAPVWGMSFTREF